MKFFGPLLISLFLPILSWSGDIVKTGTALSSHYTKCVSQVMNHPLRSKYLGGPGHSGELASLYDDTDSFCSCRIQVEKKEEEHFIKNNMAYFFKGKEEYFTYLDTCLLENVSGENFSFFNALHSFDILTPYVESRFKDLEVQGTRFLVGRGPASAQMSCVTLKVMESCQKIKSLYFTYRCLKKKMGDLDYLHSIKETCRSQLWDSDQGERI